MKLGMICRMDNSGLGTLSWEFASHLKPHKVLLVKNDVFHNFPERYQEFDNREYKAPQDFEWLLQDIDVLFSIETFYNWGIIKDCRRKGIKTVLMTMVEMTPSPIPLHPDLYICPSKLDVEYFKDYNYVYLPVPVNTEKLLWRKRHKANTFIHTASHGGVNGRKGTRLFLEAIKSVKAQARFVIYSWKPLAVSDARVSVEVKNFQNYWQMWREGDVLVYLSGANGISLPPIEAMTSGMGVIMSDIYPFNEYFYKPYLIKPDKTFKHRISPRLVEVEDYKFLPEDIAKKIDEVANTDISEASVFGKEWSEKN